MEKIIKLLGLDDKAAEADVIAAIKQLQKDAQPVEVEISDREKKINARIVPGVTRAIATAAVEAEEAEEAARAKKAKK